MNERSYIIVDNFNNHFRRNRRFIAQTTNNDINTSDLLFEDGVMSANNDNPPNTTPTVPLQYTTHMNNNLQSGNNNPELREIQELDSSSSFYDTASDGSNTDEENERVIVNDFHQPVETRTRSGRVVKPPQMYGDWTT